MWNLMNASLKALLNEQYKLVAELREENRKLKEYNWELIENHKKDIAILCEENKKLNEEIENHKQNIMQDELEIIPKLEEENKNLKSDLDKYKHYYDRDKEELMESCYWLARENDELKSDLMEDMKEITKLEKENRKLKKELEKLKSTYVYDAKQVRDIC